MSVRFADLVDLEDLQKMMLSLYNITGIPHGLVDNGNTVLCEIGWQEACRVFHRGDAVAATRCKASNLELNRLLQAGNSVGHCCLNGLMDFAVPIVVEGQHLASIVVGQVLNEPPNLEFFRQQARALGFEEEPYLAAIQKIPVIPRPQLESIMTLYANAAHMLADKGLALWRLKQAEQQLAQANARLKQQVEAQTHELAEKNQRLQADIVLCGRIESELRHQQDKLQALLDASPVGVSWSSLDGRIEYVNRKFTELFGYRLGELPTVKDWYRQVCPDPQVQQNLIKPWVIQVGAAHKSGETVPSLDTLVTCKDGSQRRVLITTSWVGDRLLANFSDITPRWQVEQREKRREQTLELIAKGYPLSRVLESIVQGVEIESPSSRCSILLLDKDGQHLTLGAAPNLPEAYNQIVDGVAIGPQVGSCGTAAYLRQRVVVADIAHDPLWGGRFRRMALDSGLRACWSEPIFSSDGRVLGTFAIYHSQTCTPTAEDIIQIGHAANLASIALEHDLARRRLEYQAHMDFLTGVANRRYFVQTAEAEVARSQRYARPLSLLMLDVDFFKQVNDRYGHKAGDWVLQHLTQLLQQGLRSADLLGRLGGEEFAILLPETAEIQAVEVAERLRRAVSEDLIQLEGVEGFSISLSIGVTTLVEGDQGLDEPLRRADKALYTAKRTGRNKVCVSTQTQENRVKAPCAGDV